MNLEERPRAIETRGQSSFESMSIEDEMSSTISAVLATSHLSADGDDRYG
jgi:hypothetical protein